MKSVGIGRGLWQAVLLGICLSGTVVAQQMDTIEFTGFTGNWSDEAVVDGYEFFVVDQPSDSFLGGPPGLSDALNLVLLYSNFDVLRVEVDDDMPFALYSVDIYGFYEATSVDIVAIDDQGVELATLTFDLTAIGPNWTSLQFDELWANVYAVEFRLSGSGVGTGGALSLDNMQVEKKGINMSTVEARLFSTAIDTGGFRFSSHGTTDYMATNGASPEPIPDGGVALYAVDIPDVDSTVVNLQRVNGGEFSLQRLNAYVFDTSACIPPECRGETLDIVALDSSDNVITSTTVSSLDGSGWRQIYFDSSWVGIRTLRLGVQAGIAGVAGTAYGLFDNFWLSPDPLQVSLDVDLWDTSNQIDPAGREEIPVGILSSSIADGDAVDFDATTVESSTLRFGAGEVTDIQTTPLDADHDSDGLTDSTAIFPTEGSGIACGDIQVALIGMTADGVEFVGTDFIETTNCGTASCHP